MQRCSEFARKGYHYYVTGEIPLSKATTFVRKVSDLYRTDLDKFSRYRRKKAGLGNAELMFYQLNAITLLFVIMVTDGEHPAHVVEKLKDARDPFTALRLTGFEMVRVTREGFPDPAWTWRMTDETYSGWRDRFVGQIRSHADEEIKKSWFSLHKSPGFAGIRQQVFKIQKLARAELARKGRKAEQKVLLNRECRSYYTRLVKAETLPLSAVLKRAYNDQTDD